MEEIKKQLSEISSKQKELDKGKRKIFDAGRSLIFEKYDSLKSFGWNQYTPYFNDGDTCEFSANIDYPEVNGDNMDNSDWSEELTIINNGTWDQATRKYIGRVSGPNPKYDPKLSEAVNEMKSFLELFDDSFYQSQFGDHTSVTLLSNGSVTQDEYEHE